MAQRVSELIDFLQSEAGLDPSRIKLAGHSLGGHIAGLAARNAKSEISEVMGKSNKNKKKKRRTSLKINNNTIESFQKL